MSKCSSKYCNLNKTVELEAPNGDINLYKQAPISCEEPKCCPVVERSVLTNEINNNDPVIEKTPVNNNPPYKTILKKPKYTEHPNFYLDEIENVSPARKDPETRSSTPFSNRLTFSPVSVCQEMTECSSVYFNDRMEMLSDKPEDRISSFVEAETGMESFSSESSTSSIMCSVQQRRRSLGFRFPSPPTSPSSTRRRHSDFVLSRRSSLSVEECPYLITESNIIGSDAAEQIKDDDLNIFSAFGKLQFSYITSIRVSIHVFSYKKVQRVALWLHSSMR